MLSATATMLLALSSLGQEVADHRAFVDLLESLQPELQDFRCEFEGTLSLKDESLQEKHGLNEDGLYDTFTGIYIWKRDGIIYMNTLHQREPLGDVEREVIIVEDGEAQHYMQLVDSPVGG